MRRMGVLACAVAVIAVAPAMGSVPQELVSWATLDSSNPGFNSQHYSWVIDGDTSYHMLGTAARLVKVNNLSGVQTSTELMSNAAWQIANGGSSGATSFYGLGQSGNYIQWSDSTTDAVWRVDKTSGAITSYVSNAQILAYQQGFYPAQTGASLLTPAAVTPTGEHVFYESTADDILMTTGPGALTTVATAADLTAVQGNSSISGGMGFDVNGDLYWGNNTNDAMYKYSGGTISEVLTQANIIAVTGGSAAGFGAVEGISPDGMVYFYETSSDDILKFDPADPATSLSIVLTKDDLLASPGASSTVYEIGFYNDMFAYNNNGTRGLYYIPEPTSLALLALGGLVGLRRRR